MNDWKWKRFYFTHLLSELSLSFFLKRVHKVLKTQSSTHGWAEGGKGEDFWRGLKSEECHTSCSIMKSDHAALQDHLSCKLSIHSKTYH